MIHFYEGFIMNNSQLSDMNVLLVEDEDIIREHTSISLSYLVCQLQTASNGKQALEILENFSPDIIITDLEMPIMNGIEFIKTLRMKKSKAIIIVLTAYATKEYLLELIEMHIEHFIVKPISLEKMINTLDSCSKLIKKENNKLPRLSFGYFYNWEEKILLFNNEFIPLSRKEILFLELLIKNSHRIITYSEIEKTVWNDNIMSPGALRSLVRNLRKKFPINLIENLSGIGYKIIYKN